MKITYMIATTGLATLLAGSALADPPATTANAVKNLPGGSAVTVTGTVEDFDSRHPFTLRDASGTVKVDMSAAKPVVLKNGQKVTVTGDVNKGLIETDIAATDVSVDTSVGESIGKAIDSITGQTPSDSAQAVNVQNLPASGLVKVNGTVDSVSSAKKFTLKDSTGNVDVNITSDQSASLKAGTPVTVVGYVDKGLLGKTINATQVNVASSQ